MRAPQLIASFGTMLCLASTSGLAQDNLEDELTALAKSMTRLVQVLERAEAGRESESGFRQVELAVRILDIRARK